MKFRKSQKINLREQTIRINNNNSGKAIERQRLVSQEISIGKDKHYVGNVMGE